MLKFVTFHEQALNDYCDWALENKKIFSKINKMIRQIQRTPFEGEGKPEALRHELAGYWSRRITDEHRLVYKIEGEHIYITQCKGHYMQ